MVRQGDADAVLALFDAMERRVERLERFVMELSTMQECCAGRFASDQHHATQSQKMYLEARNTSDPIMSQIANELDDLDQKRGG